LANSQILEQVYILTGYKNFSTNHAVQVSKMSLKLFDELQPLHRMGGTERLWLKTAALLHDIGKIYSHKMHHIFTQQIIKDMKDLPFRKKERKIIAALARYHRGASPNPSHRIFRDLDYDSRKYIRKLTSMLRLADGLCEKQEVFFEKVSCRITNQTTVIVIKTKSCLNLDKAMKKAKLFKEVFKRNIIFDVTPVR
jgi:exopolyphosphatase / guanosine-5'-triphosphate,3'-diphosphate pyrophosphatase